MIKIFCVCARLYCIAVDHFRHKNNIRSLSSCLPDLVKEMTDDKSLPKAERKALQISHASQASYRAKLVKLADKLYNLRDLRRCTPEGWSEERVQEYFEWASQVVAGLRGTNQTMEDALDQLFMERGVEMIGS